MHTTEDLDVTADTLFSICTYGVLPAWLLLVVLPGWRGTQLVVHAAWIPVLLGLAYALAIVQGFGGAPEGAGFSSLEAVMLTFTQPWAACAGWIHYLAFDLFIGAWEVRDARRHGIHHGLVVVCLALTLMFGPVGLLAYLGLRWVRVGGPSLEETSPA